MKGICDMTMGTIAITSAFIWIAAIDELIKPSKEKNRVLVEQGAVNVVVPIAY